MKNISILFLALIFISLQACSKDELKGKQSPIGEVGNTFTVGSISGISNSSVYISALNDGISTISITAELDDQDYIDYAAVLATRFPDEVSLSGNVFSANVKGRFTDKGISAILSGGDELILCEYDAGVGSSWTATAEGKLVTSTVTEKTGVDDYPYGFYYIKVSEVEVESEILTELLMQGNKLYFNHKYGFVGFSVDFGSYGSASTYVYSAAEN